MKRLCFKIISAVLALITACLCLSACSDTVKDAELRLPLAVEPTALDPQIAQGSESKTVVTNCFEGLTKLDGNGEIVPAAAESVSVSGDGLVYTFRLHDDKKWHINSNHEAIFGENWETAIDLRVTADDFVFGLRRALDPETKAPDAQRLYMIKNAAKVHSGELPSSSLGVKAVDEFTVEISLEYTSADLMSVLSEPVSMPCKQAFFEATGGRHGLAAEYILCNGPFYLSRWYKGDSIVLRRNPDNPQAQAAVFSVTYAFTTDEELILNNLLDGTYAAAPITAAQVKTATAEGCSVTEIQNSVWGLAFNCSDKLLSQTKLRLALVKATDFSVIRSAAGEDMSAPATSIIPPSCTIDSKPFNQAAQPLGSLSYDEEAAKNYYAECETGSLCEITVLCTAEYETAVRRIIQKWQQVFGITLSAKVEVLEKADLDARVAKGDYQCALTQITSTAQTPTEFMADFYGGENIFRFDSTNFNTLISQLTAAAGTQNIIDGCVKAQDYLVQNAVFCPLFYRSAYFACSERIRNVYFSHAGSIINLEDTELMKN